MTASFRKRWHLGSRQETLHRVRCALSRFECKLSKTHRTASTSTWGRWYSHHITRAFSVYTDFHTSSAFHVIDHTVYPSSLRLLFLFLSICKNALLYFALLRHLHTASYFFLSTAVFVLISTYPPGHLPLYHFRVLVLLVS